ncbi:GHKL domain-containing protein [Crocinitomix catalasitica]|nr:GHKL domain-containing protein [Crocinitomix catalasitica]
MKKKFKKRFIWTALCGFFFWFLGSYLYHFKLDNSISKSDIEEFESLFIQKSNELERSLPNFAKVVYQKQSTKEQFETAFAFSEEKDFHYFVYAEDTLSLWTTNNVPLPFVYDHVLVEHREIQMLENGWYRFSVLKQDDKEYVGSFLVKNEFDHENDDLVNSFSDALLPNLRGEITFDDEGLGVNDAKGEWIFSILPDEEIDRNDSLEVTIFFCYLLGIIILLQLLINAFQRLLISKPILLVIFPLAILIIRYLWIKSEWLGSLKNLYLFDAELYASSTSNPSLGDLIINVSIVYFLIHFLLKRTRNWFKEGNKKLKLVIFLLPLFLTSFYVAFQINEIIYTLVYDSQISFDLEQFFDLDIYSFISIGMIGASFYAYFKLIQYIFLQLRKNEFEWNRLAFLWAITSSVYVLLDQIYFDQGLLTSLWPFFLSGFLLWFEYKEKDYKFVHVITIVAFISFYAAYILQDFSINDEKKVRVVQAEKFAADKDPLTEIDYAEAERKLERHKFIQPFLSTDDFYHAIFNEQLEDDYFYRLKNKYDMKFYLYGVDSLLIEDDRNYNLKDFDRLEEIITESGTKSDRNKNMFFVKDYTDKLNYIARFPIRENDTIVGFLFSEFRSKKFPDEIGLPSLLLDSRTQVGDQLKGSSMAKYVDGEIVTRNGDYNYPTKTPAWFEKKNDFSIHENYSHYIYEEEEGYLTVLSKPVTSGLALFTSFSYLLIIFGVLLLVPLGFTQIQSKISFRNIKLNVKIQAVLIGLTLLTLVAFAIGAGTYVVEQKYGSNKDLIKEKTGSVRTELQGKLKKYDELNQGDSYYLEYILQKFSTVFVTDINLFTKGGDLLASSQPKIYSQGLVSRKMNAHAYKAIHLDHKSELIHEENIGKLNYLSAYTGFFNEKGEFLAYLNVQYISRQGELESQISGFLLAIINIMVLMLAISTILSITVSNRLTRPLKYIQDSLRTVQIGSLAKPIDYEGTDEIGQLVTEYNKKVEELQINAEALAKSERESAWREMAKQVAHEIKNPLTPMKLSIQHLKRSINLSDEESKEKLEQVTRSLIEQIDALTQIANEFSNFAKMPKADEIAVDLIAVVQSSTAVFSEYDQHEFEIEVIPEEAIIWADKDLLLRVFNNLIKNAIQAVSANGGSIRLRLVEAGNSYLVSIQDNGKGISNEQKENIFVPYFTTKSTGTGLGLAMSKQMVDGMKGRIWFDSEIDKGTTFYVSFPKHQQRKK